MAWSAGAVRQFAKEWSARHVQHLALMNGTVRGAFLDAYVLAIVRAQDAESVKVADVDQLRSDLEAAIVARVGFHYFDC